MHSPVVLFTCVQLTTSSHVRVKDEIIQGGTKGTQNLWTINNDACKKQENRHCGDATHVFTIDGKLRIKLQHLKFIKRCYVFCKVFI